MKNKLILLVGIVSCFLSSCKDEDGMNPMKCRESVITEMETMELINMPNERFKFLVKKKDGSVWWVYCGNHITANITEKYMIFPPTNPAEKPVE